MVGVYHRVAELVRFIIVFEHGHARLFALGQSRALGERACDDVAHYDFDGHYLHALDDRATLGQFLDEMRFHALFLELS